MRRLLVLLVLGAAFSSAATSDLAQPPPDELNPPELPQRENNDKLRSLLSIINAVRKLEHDLDENQQRLGKNPEAHSEKLRLENNLDEFRNVLNEHYRSNTEPDQQEKIASVLRTIQLHFSEPAKATTEVSPRWFKNKDDSKVNNGSNRFKIPLRPRAKKTKDVKQKPRKLNNSNNYKFNLKLDKKHSSSEESNSKSSRKSKSSQSSESDSRDISSKSAKRKPNSKPKGSRMKLHHNDFVSFSDTSSSSSDSKDDRKKKSSSTSESPGKKRRPINRPHLPPNVNSFWVDYWIPGPLPKPNPKQKAKSNNSDDSSSHSLASSS